MDKQKKTKFGILTALTIAFVGSLWAVLLIALLFGASNGSLETFWDGLNGSGQGQVVSAAITALGLITSALLVAFIFKDRIRDLNGAVDRMRDTLESFESQAVEQLNNLSSLFEDKLTEAEKRSSKEADRVGEVLEEIRAAVILSVSNGVISDPKHAKVFVQHLYNDAVAATQKRVKEKPKIWATTRSEIDDLKTMSRQYLDRLMDAQIIDERERGLIDQIKKFAYRRTAFSASDVPAINDARIQFDSLFDDQVITDADLS